MTDGYHVMGHIILESWEDHAAGETKQEDLLIARATRDIRLLVGLLDADTRIMVSLVEGYITGQRESAAVEGLLPVVQAVGGLDVAGVPLAKPGPANMRDNLAAVPATAQIAAPATDAATPIITWPAEEFKTLGDLGKWAWQHHRIGMEATLRAAGKRKVSQLTIAQGKAAVEQLLAERGNTKSQTKEGA